MRLLYIFSAGNDPSMDHPVLDSAVYLDLARNLARGDDPWNGAFTAPPLYPYLLALNHILTGGSVVAARIAQAILGGATCVLTCLLGRRLFDRRVGLAAGVIVALYGPMVFFDSRLLTSGLIVFCYLLSLLAAIRATMTPSWHAWLVCGLSLGLAALARPTVAPFFLLLVLCWLIVVAIRQGGWRRKLTAAVLLLAGTVLPIIPVTVRNYRACGEFVPIASLGGINLFIGNNPESRRTIAIRPGLEWDRMQRLPHADGHVTPAAAERYYVRRVADYVREQPGDFLAASLRKARLFTNALEVPRVLDPYFHSSLSATLRLMTWRWGSFGFPFGVLLPLAVLGICVGIRGQPHRLLATGFALAGAVSVIVFFNASRYRLVIVPVLAVFAVFAVVWLVRQVSERRWRGFGAGLCSALMLGALINWPLSAPSDAVNFEADFYMNLGRRLQADGNLDGALAAFAKTLTIAPESAEAHVHASRASLKLGQVDGALRHARRAAEIDSRQTTAYVALAQAHRAAGNLAAALPAARQAVSIDPTDPRARSWLAGLLNHADHHAEALEHFDRAAFYDADAESRAAHHLGMGNALVDLERYAEAIAALEIGLDDARRPELVDSLGWLLATCPDDALRDCSRAASLARESVSATGGDPVSLDTLAAAYACDGDFDEAVQVATRAASGARRSGRDYLADQIDTRARGYRAEQPWRNCVRSLTPP